jgi:uncharacterized membrane protein YdjX (TVP38/TMEM64 family)
MLQLHGGDSKDQVESSRNLKVGIAVLVPTLFLLWTYREKWIGFFNKEQLQAKTLEILEELNAMPKAYSYSAYVSGMAFWELIGASTIPVETAAGMVFGWKGFLLSSSGKLLGAIIAFVIGRYGILANWIQDKLSTNWFLQLVRASTDENPLLVAFLLKCSSFPETVKNYGSAILSPIKLWMFVVATTIHGFTFSALWTYLGVDAAARLENADLPADRRLEFLLGAALVNGIVVSPLVMAYWIKSLKAHQASLKAHQAKKKNNNEVVQKVRTWASDYKVVPKLRALVRNFVGYIWESIEQETKDRVRRKISSNDNLPQRMREKVN